MPRNSPVQSIIRSAGLPAIALIAMGFFGYYAILGPNGILALREFKQQADAKNVEYVALDKKRAAIRNRVNLLSQAKGADRDLVQELVQKGLNVSDKNTVIVPLKKAN